ncbi:unnamed protein product [Linum tenue]|nr:unnamed protein product [Linum tenue]
MMKIAQRIGKPLWVDHATSTGARLDYARVCVQVDLQKPLLSQFKIHGIKYFIQYEGLDNICLQCGTYSARSYCACSPQRQMEQEKENTTEPPVPSDPTGDHSSPSPPEKEQVYGDWMIAKKKSKARKVAQQGRADQRDQRGLEHAASGKGGSRFSVLNVEEDVVTPKEVSATEGLRPYVNSKEAASRVPSQNTKWQEKPGGKRPGKEHVNIATHPSQPSQREADQRSSPSVRDSRTVNKLPMQQENRELTPELVSSSHALKFATGEVAQPVVPKENDQRSRPPASPPENGEMGMEIEGTVRDTDPSPVNIRASPSNGAPTPLA